MNIDELPAVEMQQAFRWLCPECETENFDRSKLVVFADEHEERAARESLGIPQDEPGGIVEIPETVTCRTCLHMFRTIEEN